MKMTKTIGYLVTISVFSFFLLANSALAQQDSPSAKLNLNTASAEEFAETVPPGDLGSTSRMFREFDEYRPYISILQFRREMGKYVDEDQVAAYEEYVYVPIDRNESDTATLQQIPGLDASEAETIMEGRPYASNAAFLESVAQYVNADERADAAMYLVAE